MGCKEKSLSDRLGCNPNREPPSALRPLLSRPPGRDASHCKRRRKESLTGPPCLNKIRAAKNRSETPHVVSYNIKLPKNFVALPSWPFYYAASIIRESMELTYKVLGADGKEYGPVTVTQMQAWVREAIWNIGPKLERFPSYRKPLLLLLPWSPNLKQFPLRRKRGTRCWRRGSSPALRGSIGLRHFRWSIRSHPSPDTVGGSSLGWVSLK